MMPFQEPESQVEPPLHNFTADKLSTPRVAQKEMFQPEERTTERCTETCSRDATPEVAAVSAPVESQRCNDSTPLVKGSQFVHVEIDTQATDAYDFSPTTRRAMNNIVLPQTAEAPPNILTGFLERQPIDGPDLSCFRFGVPPKADSLKLNRPLPGKSALAKHEEASPPNPLGTTTRGCPPKVNPSPMVTSNLSKLSTLPNSRNDDDEQIVHMTNNHTNSPVLNMSSAICLDAADEMPVLDTQEDTVERVSNASTNLAHMSSCEQDTVGRPFQNIPASLPNHSEPYLPTKSSSNDSLNHPSHQQQNSRISTINVSAQPPFIDHTISRIAKDPKGKAQAYDVTPVPLERHRHYPAPQNIQKSETRGVAPNETIGKIDSAMKKLIRTFGDDLLLSGPHISEGSIQVQETQHRTLLGHSCDEDIDKCAPKSTSQQSGIPLGSPNQNGSCPGGVKGDESRLPKCDDVKIPVNRPLQPGDLQPDDGDQGRDLQASHRSKVTKRPSRTKESPNSRVTGDMLSTARGTISSVEMLQMVTVMANAERERLDDIIAVNKTQEDQLRSWNEKEIVLKDYVRKLELDNENLMGSVANYDKRARAFKDHCNEVVRAQKQLRKSADEWHQQKPQILEQIKHEVDAMRDAADKQTQKALKTFSGKTTETLKEARLKLDSQDQTIEVLQRDLNNRLLDLQREHRVAESLRKQLDEGRVQHEQIKKMLLQHHANTASDLDVQQAQIALGLDKAVEQQGRMDEFLLLISGMRDSEARTLPALEGLGNLVRSLSATVEDRLQITEDRTISVRKAGEEVLAELNLRISKMSEDQEARRHMNQRIESLVEDNATLKERVLGRERDCANMTDRLDKTTQELETCRNQLNSMTEKLRNALAVPPEDAFLRNQFLELQDKYSVLNGQLAVSLEELDNANATLRARDDSSRLVQEQVAELQQKFQQSEITILEFEAEKEAFGQEKDRASKALRMQMERDFQARLSDDDARHSGIVSSLRQQMCDHERKAMQLQAELDVAQQMSLSNGAMADNLRADIAALEMRTSQQAADLARFEEELRLKGEDGDSAAAEICLSRGKILQYENEIDKWRAQVESDASLFAKRCHESDERIKHSNAVAKTESSALREELNRLRGEVQKSDALKVAVMNSLRELTVLGHAKCLEDFVLNTKGSCLTNRWVTENYSFIENGRSILQPHSSKQEASSYFNDLPTYIGSSPRPEIPSSCAPTDLLFSGAVNTAYGGSEGNYNEDPLLDMARSPSPALHQNEDTNQDLTSTNSREESTPENITAATSSESKTARRLDDATYANSPIDRDIRHQVSCTTKSSGDGKFHFETTPDLCSSTKTMVPGPQEELTQNEKPRITRPVRRVAERKTSIVASPRTQEANRTVTRTKMTEYSVKLSKTYEASPTMRNEKNEIVMNGNPMNIVQSVAAGESSSSPLSSPPSEFDFSEYLEEPQEDELSVDNSRQHMIEGTEETVGTYTKRHSQLASEPKEVTKVRELLPPKSILKRTKSTYQPTSVVYQARTSRIQPVVEVGHPKVPNNLSKSGGKKRLPHPSIKGNGPQFNPYNRIVSGTKDTGKTSRPGTQHQRDPGSISLTSDIYTIDSSPVKSRPLGNARKRSLSNVEADGHRQPSKLQRLNRF